MKIENISSFIEGVSFVIPTFNEEKYIAQCLQVISDEIARSDLPCEIILVDNSSTDRTIEIASKFDITIYKCTTKGNPGSTRNLGAKNARYSILSFVDGDCLISKNWVSRLIEYYRNDLHGAYGGPILSPAEGNWVEKTWAPTSIRRYIHKNTSLAGGNFSIRRLCFLELHGFNENLQTAEDDDLSRRIIKAGYLVMNDSNHPVIHLGYPKDLYQIFKKQVWHGTSQLKAHGALGDKIVLLTIIWIFSIALMVLLLALNTKFFLAFAANIFIIPFFIAFKRLLKFEKKSLVSYLRMYLICWPFLAGRAVGLIKEVINFAKR